MSEILKKISKFLEERASHKPQRRLPPEETNSQEQHPVYSCPQCGAVSMSALCSNCSYQQHSALNFATMTGKEFEEFKKRNTEN